MGSVGVERLILLALGSLGDTSVRFVSCLDASSRGLRRDGSHLRKLQDSVERREPLRPRAPPTRNVVRQIWERCHSWGLFDLPPRPGRASCRIVIDAFPFEGLENLLLANQKRQTAGLQHRKLGGMSTKGVGNGGKRAEEIQGTERQKDMKVVDDFAVFAPCTLERPHVARLGWKFVCAQRGG